MIEKIFGGTAEEQFQFLNIRVIVSLVVLLIGALTQPAIIALMLYYWGWNGIKRWLGLAGLGTFFAFWGNLVVGVLVLIAFLLLGYIAGLGVFCLAVIRWVMLLVQGRKRAS